MTHRVSAREAVSRAQWRVNGPVFLCMIGPGALTYAGATLIIGDHDMAVALGAGGLLVGLLLAWLCWAVLVPRWRVWAYEHVEDLGELKRLAVATGVIWPDGHVFERTEIRPPTLRERLRELEAAHAAKAR